VKIQILYFIAKILSQYETKISTRHAPPLFLVQRQMAAYLPLPAAKQSIFSVFWQGGGIYVFSY
jgi:hypothetical protein